jgi:hypothetical protein
MVHVHLAKHPVMEGPFHDRMIVKMIGSELCWEPGKVETSKILHGRPTLQNMTWFIVKNDSNHCRNTVCLKIS